MSRGTDTRRDDAPIVLQPAEFVPMTPAQEREMWALVGRLLAPRLTGIRPRPPAVTQRALTRRDGSSDGAPPSAPPDP